MIIGEGARKCACLRTVRTLVCRQEQQAAEEAWTPVWTIRGETVGYSLRDRGTEYFRAVWILVL